MNESFDMSYYAPDWDIVWMSESKNKNFIRIVIESNRMCDRSNAIVRLTEGLRR